MRNTNSNINGKFENFAQLPLWRHRIAASDREGGVCHRGRLVCAALALVLSTGMAAARAQALDQAAAVDVLARPNIALYEAYAAFKMARYAEARQTWERLAERDVAEAWFNLGVLAEDGLGEPRDDQRALRLYQRGALGGSVKAQYRLALIHLDGRLIEPDRAVAEGWLEAAAAAGHDDSQRLLAQLREGAGSDDLLAARLLESEGRVEDAAAIYRRLSDRGDLAARTRLAWMHEAGRGVTRDLDLAATLFASAAEGGDPEAQFALSVMLRTGAGRERDLAAADVWLRRAADAGHAEAQRLLAQ